MIRTVIHRSCTRHVSFLAALALVLATATPAIAETVRGTLRFLDGDGVAEPIANAKVEIWRFRARPVIWFWGNDLEVTTDANGFFQANLPFVEPGVIWALRVFATNGAAQVFTQDIYTAPFYREPGLPGPEITFTSTSNPGAVFDFSFTFSDTWARTHFNVADAIQRGKAYADARRDPRETDTIARVDVLMNSVSTYYDPVVHAIRMTPGFAMSDVTVLHEYAHYLEERISSFLGIAASHDGCNDMGPGYAWMEGFASYFALEVQRVFGAAVDFGPPGTPLGSIVAAEFPPACPNSAPRAALERFVVAALFDLTDPVGEFFDEICVAETAVDHIVFQIFDRELDIGWTNPTLQQFLDAWVARGHDLPPLVSTFGASGVSLSTPAPLIHYDLLAAANLAVWRLDATGRGFWHILGGASGGVAEWGLTGDVPVPADYDGDGRTDLTIWRPSDGNWWILKSASRAFEASPWGTAGDVPMPGDFDNDAEDDLAVYRPSTDAFYIRADGCDFSWAIHVGDGMPVVGNFGGDARDDLGVYEPATGWFRIQLMGGGSYYQRLGTGGGTPVARDYDGDGLTDVAVFYPATGFWEIRRTTTGVVTSQWWGDPGDVTVPADYDGDGRVDIATFTPSTGMWWIIEADGPAWGFAWGTTGDVPVPAP
jgi:hypothetical protein